MILNGFSHYWIYFQKLGTVKLWRFFFLKNDPWFIWITSFFKIWYEAIRKKVRVQIKFVKCIIFLHFKFYLWKIITFLSNGPFNNNFAFLESKIIYFCLRSNFRGWITLKYLIILVLFMHWSILLSNMSRKVKNWPKKMQISGVNKKIWGNTVKPREGTCPNYSQIIKESKN